MAFTFVESESPRISYSGGEQYYLPISGVTFGCKQNGPGTRVSPMLLRHYREENLKVLDCFFRRDFRLYIIKAKASSTRLQSRVLRSGTPHRMHIFYAVTAERYDHTPNSVHRHYAAIIATRDRELCWLLTLLAPCSRWYIPTISQNQLNGNSRCLVDHGMEAKH
jgi:hypothetical protein